MKVGTGLQTGYSPSAVSWQGSASTWATSGTGVQPCPAWRGADPSTDPVPLPSATSPVLPCRLPGACQETAEPRENSSTSQQGWQPCPDGTWDTQGPLLCKCSCTLLPCQPQCPACHSIKGWRSLKDQCLHKNLYFLLSLQDWVSIYWESLPVLFLLILPILVLPLKLQVMWLSSLQNSKPQNSWLGLISTKSAAACC